MTHFQQLTKSRPSRDGFFCGIQRRDRLDAIPPFPSAGNLADKSIIPGAIFLCSVHANLHSKKGSNALFEQCRQSQREQNARQWQGKEEPRIAVAHGTDDASKQESCHQLHENAKLWPFRMYP